MNSASAPTLWSDYMISIRPVSRSNTSGLTALDIARWQPITPAEPIGDLPAPIDAKFSSEGFAALLTSFRETGGTARGDDLARLLQDRQCGDFVSLAKLIAAGKVFGFEWRQALWIPMFQFDLRDLSLKPGAQQVLAELGRTPDGWAIAAWFARANAWLGGQSPMNLLHGDLSAVTEAARADRWIAFG